MNKQKLRKLSFNYLLIISFVFMFLFFLFSLSLISKILLSDSTVFRDEISKTQVLISQIDNSKKKELSENFSISFQRLESLSLNSKIKNNTINLKFKKIQSYKDFYYIHYDNQKLKGGDLIFIRNQRLYKINKIENEIVFVEDGIKIDKEDITGIVIGLKK